MTPDQAETLITARLSADTPDAPVGDYTEHARRIALALDALGLLAYAANPQAGLQPGSPQAGAGQLNPDWATKRDRSADTSRASLAEQHPNETLATIYNRSKGE